jgi:hypothetical protein
MYRVGPKDRNGNDMGRSENLTLPIVPGSHPDIQNLAVKPGYQIKFKINTIGSLYNKKDLIRIKPKFYHVDENGENRQAVDIYYHDQEQYFIRIGSTEDRKRWLKMDFGNPNNGLPKLELNNTASNIYRRDLITTLTEEAYQQLFKRQEVKVGFLCDLYAREETRLYWGLLGIDLPEGIDKDKIERSKQLWMFEYPMPNEIFICEKNLDILQMSRKENGGPGFLNAYDNNWIKGGYLILNLDIETIINDDIRYPRLSYYNADHMNQWQLEGAKNQKQVYTDTEREYAQRKLKDPSAPRTITFTFKDGDVALFHLDKKASDDYGGYGTH